MQITYQSEWRSITADVCDASLPDLVVVSGLNGSGKTHLLEALSNGALTIDDIAPTEVKFFELGRLVPPDDVPKRPAEFRLQPSPLIGHLTQQTRNYHRSLGWAQGQTRPTLDEHLAASVVGTLLTEPALEKLLAGARKPLSELTEQDIRNHLMTLETSGDPFTASITDVFLQYHQRVNDNLFFRFLVSEGRSEQHALTDDEFVATFGQPPWEILAEAFQQLRLPYVCTHPTGFDQDAPFELVLTDVCRGVTVKTNELSSGERTLVSLALSVYGGQRLGGVLRFPRILLFDEPDASLHPLMVADMLRIASETLVGRHKTKVILTTHSPTTVALAPAASLFVMRRDAPRLQPASSRDSALGDLTAGLATLSVSIENRRQVFVESVYDAEWYSELYRLAKPWLPSAVSLEFIASAAKVDGGNDGRVTELVRNLRDSGVSTVSGIIDRDDRTTSPEHIFFADERYTIENFVLDPLIVGYLLLREMLVKPEELSLPNNFHHRDVQTEAQAIITAITSLVVTEDDDGTAVSCEYTCGQQVEIPRWYLESDGHRLEERLRATFPMLKRYRDHDLKRQAIALGFRDFPELIPANTIALFRRVAE